MVLRCSLLGHDYGDSEVEREREERGSEVVVTVQEYEECTRCGDRNVISENTEVKSLSGTATDRPTTPKPDAETAPTATEIDDTVQSDGTDAEIIGSSDDSGEFVDDDRSGVTIEDDDPIESQPAVASDHATDANDEPVTDDGEILVDDEDDGDDGREPGEWPDSSDVGPPVGAENEPTEWPDREGEQAEDAVVLEHSDSAETAAGADTVATDAEIVDGGPEPTPESTAASGSGIERAESIPTPGETGVRRTDDGPTEFYCPRCEFVESDDRGSLRAGDICPDCRKGYLGERPLQ
ncbi:DUF7093 family protein [Natrarchaeobaculum sulfurireducens]|uniref:Zn-finger domains containing protein n=1 Tax=Natrarchaeobaculum sulfurireducens TaxID=2044521 RepID=A0A346PLM7_9EURY|nr:hypothetical protein [Natrarchaeobaculum sulfurireducens]AXR80422.1 Zn-finger domains containing protein [Natrarchaeobaculum sulfurireducens]